MKSKSNKIEILKSTKLQCEKKIFLLDLLRSLLLCVHICELGISGERERAEHADICCERERAIVLDIFLYALAVREC